MSTCHQFNTPKGCKRDNCRFLHMSPSGGSQPPIKSSGKPKKPSTRSTRSTPPAPQLSSPPGTCRFFYNYGTCKISEQCKFRHVEPGQSLPRSRFSATNQPAQPTISISTPGEITVSGADALQHLATFCAPRVSFTKSFQMVTFVKLLTAAGSKMESWVRSHHIFIIFYADGNGTTLTGCS
jgi:hypothetical protein